MLAFNLLSSALVLPSSPRAPHPMQMRTALRMAGEVDFPTLDGSNVRIGIITARWHPDTCGRLVDGAKEALAECGVAPENIFETEVPGSFELPLAARYLALSGTVDAIIPIGVLIKGDTLHFEVISESVTSGLMNVGLQTAVPVVFGVLTTMTEEQAYDRSVGANNHGYQWGKAAVEMALLRTSAVGVKKQFFMGFGQETEGTGRPAEKIGF